jgi:hypothetical protein
VGHHYCSHHTFLLGFPTGWLSARIKHKFSGAVAGEKEDFCKGSLARTTFYFVFSFALLYFCLHLFIENTKKLVPFIVVNFCWSVIVLLYHAFYQWWVSLKLNLFWQGGFTEEQQKYYEEHRLSQKGEHLWEQIDKLYIIARNVCSTYNVTYCFDKYCCCRRYKHLPFQCVTRV